MTEDRTADSDRPEQPDPPDDKSIKRIDKKLLRIAQMFAPYREDPLMRDLCRLAVTCAREEWISV